jgi:hypothetical protein
MTYVEQRFATDWKGQGSNLDGGKIFRARPERPWGPPSLLYNVYRVSFPGIKRPWRGVDHPPTSSAKVNERIFSFTGQRRVDFCPKHVTACCASAGNQDILLQAVVFA